MAYDAENFIPAIVTYPPTLRGVRDLIADLPADKFDYLESFPWEFHDQRRVPQPHLCKTPMCILGWGRSLIGTTSKKAVAAAWGLAQEQLDELCFSTTGPPIITRDHAVAVLDHLLATGKVDWSIVT